MSVSTKRLSPDDTFNILLSVGDAARRCGVSNNLILKWIEDGLIEAIRLPSQHRRIRLSVLLNFMQVSGLAAS